MKNKFLFLSKQLSDFELSPIKGFTAVWETTTKAKTREIKYMACVLATIQASIYVIKDIYKHQNNVWSLQS